MLGAGYPMYPRAGDWHRSCPACRLATHHSSVPPVESLIPERHTLELMALPGGNGGKALGSSWDRGRLHWGQWLCRAGWCWNVAIPRALLSAAKPWLYLAQVRPQLGATGSPCPPAAPPHSVLPFPSASLQPPPASPPTLQHSHIFLGLSSFFPLPSLLAANFPSCCPPPLSPPIASRCREALATAAGQTRSITSSSTRNWGMEQHPEPKQQQGESSNSANTDRLGSAE